MTIPWGQLIPAAATIGSSFMGGDEGEGAGYDIYQPDPYPWSPGLLRGQASYLQSELDNLQAGRLPSWLANAIPQMREYMTQPLEQRYYGRPGERLGIYGETEALGARTGIGPKATQAQVGKAQQDYLSQTSQIDNYIASLIPGYMQGQQSAILGGIQGMPTTPEYSVMGMPAQQGGGTDWAQLGSALGGIDWGSMLKKETAPTSASSPTSAFANDYSLGSGSYGLGSYYGSGTTNFSNSTSYQPLTSSNVGL